ncbi:MAG: hypothetical protein KDC66_20650 [Phaeodactylibacter sp.]|nr:hypothetical protein [Phaeodactylibacter sp.]MCB9272506.1 hypothetical protein [Lewinellaceae bacterium]
MSIQSTHLVFREAKDIRELEALFRLRYQGYVNSACASLVRQNEAGLEFDTYDWHSLHLGLFQQGSYGSHPVGYARLVQTEPSSMAPMVSSLAARYSTLNIPAGPSEDAPLPFMANCPKAGELAGLLDGLKQQGARLVEGSRFVFSPDTRSSGYARFAFEAATAKAFFRYHYDFAFLAVHPRHAPFYGQYGFQEIVNGEENDYLGLKASVLALENGKLAPRRANRIESMGKAASQLGAIFLFPDNSQVFAPTPAAMAA